LQWLLEDGGGRRLPPWLRDAKMKNWARKYINLKDADTVNEN
jgi:hypothetical protein